MSRTNNATQDWVPDRVVSSSSRSLSLPTMSEPTSLGSDLVIGVIADFNPHNFARLLERNCRPFRARCHTAPLGQSLQLLLTPTSEFWQTKCDAVMIWTFPELAVPEFHKVLRWTPFSLEALLAQVDDF